MSEDNKFIPGLFVKAPHERAPDFIKASLSIKVKDLGNFLREKNSAGEEWVNIDVKESMGGKWYAAINDFKPEKQEQRQEQQRPQQPSDTAAPEDFDDDIPF